MKDQDERTKEFTLRCNLYLGGKNGDKLYFGKPIIYDEYPTYKWRGTVNQRLLEKSPYHVDTPVIFEVWNLREERSDIAQQRLGHFAGLQYHFVHLFLGSGDHREWRRARLPAACPAGAECRAGAPVPRRRGRPGRPARRRLSSGLRRGRLAGQSAGDQVTFFIEQQRPRQSRAPVHFKS